ncbi:L,D-transpeptidase family protein [Novosphingobium lentum]|uniref:L,D-transpeptidase family protein n=1 Tax=Novosphingobium lentum TaxID=145287 RepID=UPI0008333E1E|nr:L,D-transpeptidase family protein [Novosphingobium lentum]
MPPAFLPRVGAVPAPALAAVPLAQPAADAKAPAPLPDPQPPSVEDALRSGVLIVVSKASQHMHVFKDGEAWDSTPVSTGRRGHATPAGVFPILQKQLLHRSNIYSNAPMPFMQRLTWSGIAIHAGRLPGYAASHGCIRVPYGFARSLYGLTKATATTVVIANEPIRSDDHARSFALALRPPQLPATGSPPRAALALATRMASPPVPAPPRTPFAQPVAAAIEPAVAITGQTIQLAATASLAESEAHWAQLLNVRPELGRFRKAVVPAIVGSRRVFRLRVSAPDAHAYCSRLKSAGIACFNVI